MISFARSIASSPREEARGVCLGMVIRAVINP
jgi:hypothetical protein